MAILRWGNSKQEHNKGCSQNQTPLQHNGFNSNSCGNDHKIASNKVGLQSKLPLFLRTSSFRTIRRGQLIDWRSPSPTTVSVSPSALWHSSPPPSALDHHHHHHHHNHQNHLHHYQYIDHHHHPYHYHHHHCHCQTHHHHHHHPRLILIASSLSPSPSHESCELPLTFCFTLIHIQQIKLSQTILPLWNTVFVDVSWI